jgi:hypothetical protein
VYVLDMESWHTVQPNNTKSDKSGIIIAAIVVAGVVIVVIVLGFFHYRSKREAQGRQQSHG